MHFFAILPSPVESFPSILPTKLCTLSLAHTCRVSFMLNLNCGLEGMEFVGTGG
jgi:hypothetical protein